MNTHLRRVERIERANAPSGRLIVVRANSEDEANETVSVAGLVIRPSDNVVKIRRVVVDPRPDEQRIEQSFLSVDGQPVPLVRETMS